MGQPQTGSGSLGLFQGAQQGGFRLAGGVRAFDQPGCAARGLPGVPAKRQRKSGPPRGAGRRITSGGRAGEHPHAAIEIAGIEIPPAAVRGRAGQDQPFACGAQAGQEKNTLLGGTDGGKGEAPLRQFHPAPGERLVEGLALLVAEDGVFPREGGEGPFIQSRDQHDIETQPGHLLGADHPDAVFPA